MAPASRMPERRIMEVLRPVLTQLDDAKSLAAQYRQDHASSSTLNIDKILENIYGELQFIRDIVLQVEIWEKDVNDKIGDIAKHLDIALENGSNQREFQSKLRIVNQTASALKENMVSPFQLQHLQDYIKSVYSNVLASPSSTVIEEPYDILFYSVDELQDFFRKRTESEAEVTKNRIINHPPHLQQILLFLHNFPAGNLVKKRLLSYWWMGEQDDSVLLDRYLRELKEGGYIELFHKGHKLFDIDNIMLKPSIHQVLTNTIIRHGHANPMLYDPLSSHPCPSPDRFEQIFQTYGFAFRTCYNVNQSYLKFEKNRFLEMKGLFVLMLGRWQRSPTHHIEVENTEFLEWLGSLKMLRYLSLQGISRITKLTSSIGQLKNLRILDLRACHNLERLPVELTTLTNLTHLDASECYLLDHMPKGLGALSKLRVLKGFVVGSASSRSGEPCHLGELSRLDELRKLSINIRGGSVLEEEEFDELSKSTSLVSLTITWAVPVGKLSSSQEDSTVLTVSEKDVSPPPNLEKLDLRCIPQSTAPQWLSASKLSKLERLYIRGGNLKLRSLCGSGLTWPSVKILRVRFLQGVDMEVKELHNAFPNLDYLQIHNCNDSKLNHNWPRNCLEQTLHI